MRVLIYACKYQLQWNRVHACVVCNLLSTEFHLMSIFPKSIDADPHCNVSYTVFSSIASLARESPTSAEALSAAANPVALGGRGQPPCTRVAVPEDTLLGGDYGAAAEGGFAKLSPSSVALSYALTTRGCYLKSLSVRPAPQSDPVHVCLSLVLNEAYTLGSLSGPPTAFRSPSGPHSPCKESPEMGLVFTITLLNFFVVRFPRDFKPWSPWR